MEQGLNLERKKILEELALEEESENHLIWLYRTLLDLGVEKCIVGEKQEEFRKGMNTLYEESRMHKVVIHNIINNYL